MTNQEPNYELSTDKDVAKFMLGAIRDLRKNDIDVAKALTLSKMVDSYTKVQILIEKKKQLKKEEKEFNLEKEKEKLLNLSN